MGFATALAGPIGLIGTGISVLGSISQGQAEANAANYQAQVARNNATIANNNARYAQQAGETQAYNEGLKQRAVQGAIATGLAAGGIDVNSGSAADVRKSAAELGQEDVETVRQKAALEAYGFRTQSTNYTSQASLDTATAQNAQESGFIKGAGSLLSGVAKFGGGGGLFSSDTDPNTGWTYASEKSFLPA